MPAPLSEASLLVLHSGLLVLQAFQSAAQWPAEKDDHICRYRSMDVVIACITSQEWWFHASGSSEGVSGEPQIAYLIRSALCILQGTLHSLFVIMAARALHDKLDLCWAK